MLRSITRIPARIYFLGAKIKRKILYVILKPIFHCCGKNLQFSPTDSIFTFHTISIGDDVHIGPGAKFIASISSIKIGNKVMFGPNVTIRGGNHNTSVIGKYMRDVTDKRPEDDLPVIIEDDVWVGTNVTILKGVKIGRGSIIAAGAVVNKDVPRYSIAGGVPAKVIKKRWNESEIRKHEQFLGIH